MNKQLIKMFGIAFMAFITMYGFQACTKDEVSSDTTTVDALANETLFTLEQRGNLGKHGCYDLVFPVSIKLADGTIITATNQDSLHSALKQYHKNKPGQGRPKVRPNFVFPISVIAEDGSVIVVQNETELHELRKACHKDHLDSLHHKDSLDHKGFPRHDTLCFSLVFPLKVTKGDGTQVTVNTKEELKALAKTEHGQGRGHGKKHGVQNQLQLVFPIQVKKANGTTVTINTKEELKALREGC